MHTETKVEMGRSYSKNEGQQVDQTLCRIVIKEREEIKRTTKQKMARRHNKEGGNLLDQESNRQTTMEDTDGRLHPAVDGPSLDKKQKTKGKPLAYRKKTLLGVGWDSLLHC